MTKINEIGNTSKYQYLLGKLQRRKFDNGEKKSAEEIGKYADDSAKNASYKNDTKLGQLRNSHKFGWADQDSIAGKWNENKVIKLSEEHIVEMVKGVLNEIFNEAQIPYDKNFLDGIDSIDNRSINYFIQAMIPEGNRVSVNSPYKAIRQLVLYFSPEGAVKHGGRLTKDIVNNILKDDGIRKAVRAISLYDRKILDLIYGQKRLTGKPLMQEIVWNLDSILEQLMVLNTAVEKSNIKNYFDGTQALSGSEDGKRVGLSTIMFRAFMGIDEIKKQIKKMQAILDKGKDVFSYGTGKFNRK